MIKIPNETKQLTQSNRSDILGNILVSFNLDLTSNLGKIRFSPRMILNTTEDAGGSLNVATAFVFFEGVWWATAGNFVWKQPSGVESTFAKDAGTGTPTDLLSADTNPDMIAWKNVLYVSGNNKIYKLPSPFTTWTAITGGDGSQGSIVRYGNKLYFVNNDTEIAYTDGTTITVPSGTNPNTTASTLDLANSGESKITCMRASSNRIWIGTASRGGKGRVYEWDGVSVTEINFYTLESQAVMAMAIKDDVPWIVDAEGRLLVFNGGSFQEKARLPVPKGFFLHNQMLLTPTSETATEDRFIHFNGISVQDESILLLISNRYQANDNLPLDERLPSGVWEYNERNGLHHKYSLSHWAYSDTSETDYGMNLNSFIGALASDNRIGAVKGTLLASALYDKSPSGAYGIFFNNKDNDIVKTGYLITPQIHSQNIQDTWQQIAVIHQEYQNSTDSIKTKFRTKKESPTYIEATWTSTTTFTTTTNILGKEGYEVEILNKTGAGMVAHISSIDWNNSVYTVTLDETITGATGTSDVRLLNWTLIDQTKQDVDYKEFSVGRKSRWVQFKVFFKGTGENEIDELLIDNVKHK